MAVKTFDLVFVGRPVLLVPVWTVYLHYLAVCGSGELFRPWPAPAAFLHLSVLTLLFMGIYVFNQIFDIESDRLNDKLYFLPRNIIGLKTAWIYYTVLTVAGLAVVVAAAREVLWISAAIAALGILYSAPGVRLKDSPYGGLLANAVAYGYLIPTMAAVYIGRPPGLKTIPYFLAIATGYILTTIPDHDGDLAAGKRTVAVVLDPKSALWLALLTAAATVPASLGTGNREMAVVAAVTGVGISCLLFRFTFRGLLFVCKFPILLLTLLAGAHYLFYLPLLLLTIILTRFYYKRRFGVDYPDLG